MSIKEIIDTIKVICEDLDYNFYHIQDFDVELYGKTEEYPKVVLIKPIETTNNIQPPITTMTLTIESLDVFNRNQNSDTNIKLREDGELEIIDQTESKLVNIINKIRLLNYFTINSYSIMSLHNQYTNQISGSSLTINLTTRLGVC
jgi:hypothetical protein